MSNNFEDIIENTSDYEESIIDNPYYQKKIDYKNLYKKQLLEMEQLGLYDIDLNIKFLIRSNGNLSYAVSLIFENT